MSLLSISHVSASYGDCQVLHDISFDLPMGRSLCILGPNGCGKTTLLRAIASLIPFKGSITLGGVPLSSMKRLEIASRVAVMSQITKIYFSYSVYETVMLGRYQHIRRSLFGRPAAEDREYVEHCLKTTGLSDIRDKQIDELSGGQLQRVFLARTLAQEPQIILLDEPTNHLDLKHQVELVNYLKEWAKSDSHAIIGVFHDINLALRLSENMLFIKDGKIAGRGLFHEIVNDRFLQDVYGIDVVGYMNESFEKWAAFGKTDAN